ncbi:hypothetical protein K457DRAFT_282607 [Linnemannia elongata AG-77]|uniref:Uncharacterized protein n=1 Tax=Linnemannia elongata AG-77 TaxID=1314771 RepID=A0A197JDX3_9FUNG|nr:hypothetical protein K457DRAFT_282607 [Linnemannia elongata AG-77]
METWVALKMLKVDMATETEGEKDEIKRRKQPSRGVAAAQQADEEQSRQKAPRIAESFESYNRKITQVMSRDENTQFSPFLSVPQTIAETGQTSGAHTPSSPNHQ